MSRLPGALRIAFFVVLLLGINAESRSDLRALRSAYAALDRLSLSEAERATLEERTRLARELHDGLAQDLWFAKLKHERLVPYVPEEQKPLAIEVTQRHRRRDLGGETGSGTMRTAEERERPLEELISGSSTNSPVAPVLRADFSVADLPDALSRRKQVEVLRILQEALTNVRKHADATVVRVVAEVSDGRLLLGIIDNGRGFRPDETSGDGLGVAGHEGASAADGRRSVRSVGAERRHSHPAGRCPSRPAGVGSAVSRRSTASCG